MKLDRTELIRLIEAVPVSKAKSSRTALGVLIGIGVLTIVASLLALGIIMARTPSLKANKFRLIALGSGAVMGGTLVAMGGWVLARERRFEEMMSRYGDQIQAGDLAAALAQTERFKLGEKLALDLWKDGKNPNFGFVWLAGQCGNRKWDSAFIVLRKMEGAEAIIKSLRDADARLARSTIWVAFPVYIANPLSKLFKSLLPASLSEGLASVLMFLFWILFGGIGVAYVLFLQTRKGEEWQECYGFLSRLPDEDLGVLVGKGRLGRIAKAVQADRTTRKAGFE